MHKHQTRGERSIIAVKSPDSKTRREKCAFHLFVCFFMKNVHTLFMFYFQTENSVMPKCTLCMHGWLFFVLFFYSLYGFKRVTCFFSNSYWVEFPHGITVNVCHPSIFTETCFFRRLIINHTPGSHVLPAGESNTSAS